MSTVADEIIELDDERIAHNYHPLPVVLATADGSWVTDVGGLRYFDALAGYSALNFGHRHPALIEATKAQLDRVTLTSRAFYNDQLAAFAEALVELLQIPDGMVLPMNTGAEAVESAIKVARKWGYEVKGVADGQANIVVAGGNFHGRTITIISFSEDEDARAGFGPYTPGFRTVPYGDAAAVADAIDENTVAVLLEPIQGEAGIIVPPEDYLPAIRRTCTDNNVLLIVDEIQSGLGRTGTTLAQDLSDVRADLTLLGKALGGGIVPVSAVVGSASVLGVLQPGQHGSTFGGNPLASAVGHKVVDLLATGEFQERSATLGKQLLSGLESLVGEGLVDVRGVGLWAGLDVDPNLGTGRQVCKALQEHQVLAKDTHGSTLRLAPPLVVTDEEVTWLVEQVRHALVDVKVGNF
ncbi:MAG: ornithine--oxo-acid transaminase [Actinobacteria bacterium]|nr:ornithine--oxo-acid transaminase [Actinomycetota bacterium]